MKTKELIEKTAVPILVGADIGFGEVKSLSSAFPEPVSFPSAVVAGAKPSSSKMFDLSEIDKDCLIVTTEEGTFFVGEQAMRYPLSGSKRTQARDRANDLTSRVLFETTIALNVPHEDGEYDVFVVTGLPNDDYDLSIKRNLKEFLSGKFTVTIHLSETRTITKTINIVGSEVLRQPEGSVTFNQFVFDPVEFITGSKYARRNIGIMDFGHFTTDFALFQEGIIVDNETMNGSTVGVTEVYNKLKKKLIVKFDEMGFEYRATDADLDNAVRNGVVHYMGKDRDVTAEVKESAKEVARIIAKAVLDAWGNETNRLELIIISGGGSHLFAKYVEEEFTARKKQGLQSIEAPQYSNAIGFYMYGCLELEEQLELSKEDIFKEYVLPAFPEVE